MKYFFLATLVLFPAFAFAQESVGFVPLTNIQNVRFAGNSAELPAFLNAIYMLCIGLAAVIGVLQIMRAGVTWMTAAGSHEKIGDAKKLVQDTIIGLILVLAPTIVFSIINPDILSLKIRGLEQLTLPDPNKNTTANILWSDASSGREDMKKRCEAQGGSPVFRCYTPGKENEARTVDYLQSCAEGEKENNFCVRTDKTDLGMCSEYVRKVAVKDGQVCDAVNGYTQVNAKDCCGLDSGLCCGSKYSLEKPYQPKVGCTAIANGTDLGFDTTKEMCCNAQQGNGISCVAQKISKSGRTETLMCVCSYK